MNSSKISQLLILLLFFSGSLNAQSTVNRLSDARLNAILKSEKKFSIDVLGSGNIQSSFDDGKDIPASTGVGVHLTKYFSRDSLDANGNPVKDGNDIYQVNAPFNLLGLKFYKIELDANINIASTVDTLSANFNKGNLQNQREFGSAILRPIISGQAVEISLTGYFQNTYLGILSGVHFEYISSNRNWLLMDSLQAANRQASTTMLRAGLFHDFIPAESRDDYAVTMGLAFGYNSISGDIALDNTNSINLRDKILGTDQTYFFATELSLGFRLHNLKADFAYSWIPSDTDISGFTGSRFVTRITFVGGFGLDMGKGR